MPDLRTPAERLDAYLAESDGDPPAPVRRTPWPAQAAAALLSSLVLAGTLLMGRHLAQRAGLWPWP